MKIEPYVEYKIDISGTFRFGDLPSDVAETAFSNGRQCGVLLEYDAAEKFKNISKEGCGQGSGADVVYLKPDRNLAKVQCKTVKLKKEISRKKKKFLIKKTADEIAGRVTKSTLFDTSRRNAPNSTKEHYTVWDTKHQNYFSDYDYFLFFPIDDFPIYRVLMIPTVELFKHSDIPRQVNRFIYYQKNGKKSGKKYKVGDEKNPGTPFPDWDWPLYITHSMYHSWIKRSETYNG